MSYIYTCCIFALFALLFRVTRIAFLRMPGADTVNYDETFRPYFRYSDELYHILTIKFDDIVHKWLKAESLKVYSFDNPTQLIMKENFMSNVSYGFQGKLKENTFAKTTYVVNFIDSYANAHGWNKTKIFNPPESNPTMSNNDSTIPKMEFGPKTNSLNSMPKSSLKYNYFAKIRHEESYCFAKKKKDKKPDSATLRKKSLGLDKKWQFFRGVNGKRIEIYHNFCSNKTFLQPSLVNNNQFADNGLKNTRIRMISPK